MNVEGEGIQISALGVSTLWLANCFTCSVQSCDHTLHTPYLLLI